MREFPLAGLKKSGLLPPEEMSLPKLSVNRKDVVSTPSPATLG